VRKPKNNYDKIHPEEKRCGDLSNFGNKKEKGIEVINS